MSGWLGVLLWALTASALHMRGRRRLVDAARAGHEVRGPLCTAQLALDGLERSARVEAIGLELRRATLALDDLTGARPRARSERVDLARLLTTAEGGWRAAADANGVRLELRPCRAVVTGDPLRLAQALANLVANAIEHGGGHVRVSSSTAGGRSRVEVTDRGPGLPAPVADLVVGARGRRTARGHGLAIAAAVAASHGGTLTSLPAARGAHLVLDLPEPTNVPPRRTRRQRPVSSRADAPPEPIRHQPVSSRADAPPAPPRSP